ncbi:MAG: T9SS type A sorting domain-containing protein [Bacteroidetes bacterium]|jgi:polyhydroxybutyrate depolymerase|nr:T9SS type A sorting domain-containing protein [Bacteroidota bacterium]
MNIYHAPRLLFTICLLAFFTGTQAQQTRSLKYQGQDRSFIHYTPADYDPDSLYPLVFILHGFTQRAADIMDYSNFNSLAEEHDFIAVYPNGINRSWNTQSGFPGGSTADDVGFIEALIDLLLNEQNIDPTRVYACGFSAGGFMSYILACQLQDKMAAIAAVAGTYSSAALNSCQPIRPFPILHIHGSDDLIVPPGGSLANSSVEETLAFWRMQNDCDPMPDRTEWPDEAGDGTRIEQFDYLSCRSSSALTYLRVVNGGHTWPGAPEGSGIGTTSQNLDASEAIWEFFAQYQSSVNTQSDQSAPTKIRLFPNPAHRFIQIQIPRNTQVQHCKIFNLEGIEVLHSPLPQSNITLEISQLPPGFYWLQVKGYAPIPWIKI